jgi:hypothetical protein
VAQQVSGIASVRHDGIADTFNHLAHRLHYNFRLIEVDPMAALFRHEVPAMERMSCNRCMLLKSNTRLVRARNYCDGDLPG